MIKEVEFISNSVGYYVSVNNKTCEFAGSTLKDALTNVVKAWMEDKL